MCQPWCIQYLELKQAQSYELKFGLIHLLPKFHGFHLKEFHDERNLISNMVSNTQQFGVKESTTSKIVNEVVVVGNHRWQNKITELTSFVRQLAISPLVRVCGICTSVEHPTIACPILQETELNSSPMINTQTRDMVQTLHNMYLRDTNHNLRLNNNNLCSLYSRVPWRIWSSKWP
ncbi:hypothetical protein CR513_15299, partial [Mucuna pruriens]